MSTKPTIVDNVNVAYYINPQYVNVTDQISTEAYDYVQTAQLSAYNQTLGDITTPRWSFSYEFNGTRISVFGVVIPYITGPLPAAQYAVDGVSLNTSTVPNTTRTLTGVNFYTSQYFPSGPHVLTVNVTTATSDGPYLFDYLAIDTTDPPASSSSSSSSSTTSSSSQTSSSASPSTSGTALHAEALSKSSAPTGAIVGGVVGGVILLAAIAIGAWWLWKKHRTYDQSSYSYARTGQYDGPDPHVEAYTYSSPPSSYMPETTRAPHTESLYSGAVAPMMATSFHRPSLPASAPVYSAAPVSSKASLAQSRQHSLPQSVSQYSVSQPAQSEYAVSQPPHSQYSVSQPASEYSQPHSLEASYDALVPAAPPPPLPLSGAARKAAEARLEAQVPLSPEAGGSDLSAVPPPYAP
ncbi:hypothetical protein OH76DRAFT_1405738 [Lentinus brumalis]|uniref:Mid2 domain-containing protein n=1 Tax=Lentinus brumalis TaxID=2498619 RepID=A0A371D552_9APHY|nr:hypothetical protein OH76DRAFT_1405738 [Polyporus brumalis]